MGQSEYQALRKHQAEMLLLNLLLCAIGCPLPSACQEHQLSAVLSHFREGLTVLSSSIFLTVSPRTFVRAPRWGLLGALSCPRLPTVFCLAGDELSRHRSLPCRACCDRSLFLSHGEKAPVGFWKQSWEFRSSKRLHTGCQGLVEPNQLIRLQEMTLMV